MKTGNLGKKSVTNIKKKLNIKKLIEHKVNKWKENHINYGQKSK